MSEQTATRVQAAPVPTPSVFEPLIPEFLAYLRRLGLSERSIPNFPGPAKHLLVWLHAKRIDVNALDIDTVRRFFAHECHCVRPPGERYQNRLQRSRDFQSRTLQFVRFLEDSGRVSNPMALDAALERVEDFVRYLGEQGYAVGTVDHYRYSCRHFVAWLHQYRTPLAAVDEGVMARFGNHDCICPGFFTLRAERSRHCMGHVRRFVKFLAANGVILRGTMAARPAPEDSLASFREWLRRHRGIGEQTIFDHVRQIRELLAVLKADPGQYDAALIRRVVLQRVERASRTSVQRMTGSLRMYLRFLASTGACPASLVHAIPTVPRWRLATLPRYILQDDVELVIASCDLTTPRGLRDRAILLLLSRLALRAGDVAHLRLHDIDWDRALIKVSGKSKRVVALPLPQDVGDALSTYIEHARPAVDADKVFIRAIAPFQPFSDASAIGSVVRDALKRAGVRNAHLRGAHLLRHSAATHMLRSGATLEAVGAVLRHRSPETTAIYAKVDTSMLAQVVQPWIGGATCR
ncbi:integrase [Variovorax sp. WS11]|uniref:tyrosine-type recombinase/integrase n=1 Tax=Variovorax sp. WS11 TaxID=1105204 RepID=UPI000D0CE9BF|nr:tyrosine-type recombinase/integrase [Variovorax sp. WS11]NDZ17190.1 tyrosine-type recombinase/integrase [Variovorax sp. WS11]PSL79114.1 integrase [Variovorax sp. WS11]